MDFFHNFLSVHFELLQVRAVEALVGIRKINCHPVLILSCYLRAFKTSLLVILISIPQSTTPLLFQYQKMYIHFDKHSNYQGHLTSKGFFGILDSSKKNNEQKNLT